MPLEFDPADPFPLREVSSITVAEARRHSRAADEWLGLRPEEIERTLPRGALRKTGHELWLEMPIQNVLTTYTEFRWVLEQLAPAPGSTVVDLGAGYGRMGLVIGRHYPDVTFVGYEYVAERVEEARGCFLRWKYPLIRMEQVDLSHPEFAPCEADNYFIYDFGTREAIEGVLQNLKQIATHRAITVAGRGRRCRDIIERSHPWLSRKVLPEHHPNMSVYRSQLPR